MANRTCALTQQENDIRATRARKNEHGEDKYLPDVMVRSTWACWKAGSTRGTIIMANEYIPVQNRNQLAEAAGVLTYKFFELYGGDTPD